jgi:hypothetical protein
MRDTTADSSGNQDFFRVVERSSPKEIQWLLKLGMALVETYDQPLLHEVPGRKFLLSELPTHYKLFEHVRIPGPVCSGSMLPCDFDHN